VRISSKLTVSCSHSFSHSNSVPYVWMIRIQNSREALRKAESRLAAQAGEIASHAEAQEQLTRELSRLQEYLFRIHVIYMRYIHRYLHQNST
jgi:hypothetical protein